MHRILHRLTGDEIAAGETIRAAAEASRGNLSEAYLSGADFSGAYLSGADLSGAYLSGAHLADASLRGADLSGAHLADAHLVGASLRGATLGDAYLHRAYLSDADLRGAGLIIGPTDARGYAFYVTWGINERPPRPIIRAGCRRWLGFDAARAHYNTAYGGYGDPAECLAALGYLEERFKARMAERKQGAA